MVLSFEDFKQAILDKKQFEFFSGDSHTWESNIVPFAYISDEAVESYYNSFDFRITNNENSNRNSSDSPTK